MSDDDEESSDSEESLVANDDDSNSAPAPISVGTIEPKEKQKKSSENKSEEASNNQDQFIPLVVRMKRDKQLSKLTNFPYIFLISGIVLLLVLSFFEGVYYSGVTRYWFVEDAMEVLFCSGCLLVILAPIVGFTASAENKKRISKMQKIELEKYGSVENVIQESEYFARAPKIVIDPSKQRIKHIAYILSVVGFVFVVIATSYAGVDDDYCNLFCGMGTILLAISGIGLASVANSKSVGDWLIVAFSLTIAGLSGLALFAYWSY